MKVQAIDAYKTTDGRLFESEKGAIDHQTDIVGELLDTLLPVDDRGNVTASDRFNLLTKMLADERLPKIVARLNAALNPDF